MVDLPWLLRTTFGFESFRGVQGQVVDRVLGGRQHARGDADRRGQVALLSIAGAGCCPGTCVVISPLIALMHDQLRAAEAVGIRAATLTSVDANRAETRRAVPVGRSRSALCRARTRVERELPPSCSAQAASACSRSTRRIASANGGMISAPITGCSGRCSMRFRDVPRLALTATADAHTRADILDQLGIPADGLIVAGFDRPNIRYAISAQGQHRAPDRRADRRAARPGHRLCPDPRGDRKARRAAGGKRAADPRLSCRAGAAGPREEPGRFRRQRGHGDGRHRRVRHGHRQARRPLRRACRHPQIDRGLLPGNRPRRARRRSGGRASVLGRGGFRARRASGSTRSRPNASRASARG